LRLSRSAAVPRYLVREINATWLWGHDIDDLALFAGVAADERLADRCARCLAPVNEGTIGITSLGVTCPEPEGIGPFPYGQLVLVEVGGRILHGEFIVFEDEPELQVPGEWSVHLPVCSASCNLLIRALARADVVRAFGSLPDAQAPYLPTLDANDEPDDREWTPRDHALARVDGWIEDLLEQRLDRCGWCDARSGPHGLTLAAATVDGDDTRRRRPAITAVRLAHRLVPALPVPGTPDPWVCVLFCSDDCQRAARHAVEAAGRQPRH
jgi:hypothetical protein